MPDELNLSCSVHKKFVEIVLKINNVKIHKDTEINLFELAKSCQSEGIFYFFTCVCGEPRCAGIYEGTEVKQLPEAILWKLYIEGALHHFSFDPMQYENAINQVLGQIKSMYANESGLIQLPIFGQRWEDLLKLNTQVFSNRVNAPGKRVVANCVELGSHHNIRICGMDFNIEDLFLPEELVEQYKSWMKHAGYEDNQKETPEFVEFLNQGKSFSRALEKYLGKQVKLKYYPPRLSSYQSKELLKLFGYIK